MFSSRFADSTGVAIDAAFAAFRLGALREALGSAARLRASVFATRRTRAFIA